MSLLREIQGVATDPAVDITTVLRKAKILAARLKSPDFTAWVDRELNGYADKAELPAYRILRIEAKASLIIGFYQQMPTATVFPSGLPEEFRHWATTAFLLSPISEYGSLVKSSQANHHTNLESPWPQALAVKYGGYGYNEAQCLRAWQEISTDAIVGMIESVRNRVLDFALQIEAEAPDAGEASPGSEPVPPEKVQQVFHTVILGGVNNIAAGSSQVSQANSGHITSVALDPLLDRLRSLGVPSGSVDEFHRTIESGPDPKAAVEGWLGKLALSAGTGITGAVIQTAAKTIAAHFGWQS